jgi:hypothetical protein
MRWDPTDAMEELHLGSERVYQDRMRQYRDDFPGPEATLLGGSKGFQNIVVTRIAETRTVAGLDYRRIPLAPVKRRHRRLDIGNLDADREKGRRSSLESKVLKCIYALV